MEDHYKYSARVYVLSNGYLESMNITEVLQTCGRAYKMYTCGISSSARVGL